MTNLTPAVKLAPPPTLIQNLNAGYATRRKIQGELLGPGPINQDEMTPGMTRNARKSLEGRAGGPAENFDEAVRSHAGASSGWGEFDRLQRHKTLKTGWFPAVSFLVSNQIPSHHFVLINGS
jgi:hypothetical protein